MESFTMKSFISAIVGATIVAIATSGVDRTVSYKEKKQYQEKMASILYNDLENGRNLIEFTISRSPQVPYNSHSMILNNYLDYYASLYPRLDNDSSKKLMSYYRNIKLLEDIRQIYWSDTDDRRERNLLPLYQSILLGVKESLQSSEMKNVISTLKERAGIKD